MNHLDRRFEPAFLFADQTHPNLRLSFRLQHGGREIHVLIGDVAVELPLDRWGDRKVLAWTLANVGTSACQLFRITPKPCLKKPPELSDEVWQNTLKQQFLVKSQDTDQQSLSWEQFCKFSERVCFDSIQHLGFKRRQPSNSHKREPAKTERVFRYHKGFPQFSSLALEDCGGELRRGTLRNVEIFD